MNSSSKRKVVAEKSLGDSDKSKPSVFTRLGPGVSSRSSDPASSSSEICSDFSNYGRCDRGSKCNLLHVQSNRDRMSDDRHRSSRSKHDDGSGDAEKLSRSHRDSKDSKMKSAVGLVSKHSSEPSDSQWPEISGSRSSDAKVESKHESSTRQKESPSKSSGKGKNPKLESEMSSKSKKKKRHSEGSFSPEHDGSHKRHHHRQNADEDVAGEKKARESAKQQNPQQTAESSRSAKSKDSSQKSTTDSKLQKLALDSESKDNFEAEKRSKKVSPGQDVASESNAGSSAKKDALPPLKPKSSKEKEKKHKEHRKDQSMSPLRVKAKGTTGTKGPQTAKDAKGQKHGTKRSRHDSSSSSSSGSSSTSGSSSGSTSSGSSSSSDSSSSASPSPQRHQKAVKRNKPEGGGSQKKRDSGKRKHVADKVPAVVDDRQDRDAFAGDGKLDPSSRGKDGNSQRPAESSRTDDRDRRHRDQTSPQPDSSGRRDINRDDGIWRADVPNDVSLSKQRTDRDKGLQDSYDERRRTNDASPRLQKSRDDRESAVGRDNDRRKRDSSPGHYTSKTSIERHHTSTRYDRDELNVSSEYNSYDQRELSGLQERADEHDVRDRDRERERDSYGERYHAEFDSRDIGDRDFESRDRGYDRNKEYVSDRNRRGDGGESSRRDRVSRRGQWENDRDVAGFAGRRAGGRPDQRGHSDKYDTSRKRTDYGIEGDRSPLVAKRQRDLSPNQFDRDSDKERERGRSGRDAVRDAVRDDDRRTSRGDQDRSRNDRSDREREKGGDGRGDVEWGYRDRERGNDRDRGDQMDRSGRDRDHADQEWEHPRRQEQRERNRESRPDSSDVKSGGRSDRRGNWRQGQDKRRRSASIHEGDSGWDRHRADKKRSRYDEDDKNKERMSHRDEPRYSASRDHSPKSSVGYGKQDRLESSDRRRDESQGKLAVDSMRNKVDDKRDLVSKEAELSSIPPYVSDDRARRSQSHCSIGSRTSQRIDNRTDYRYDAHHDYRTGDLRDPRGRDIRDRSSSNLTSFSREPFLEADSLAYFRADPSRVPPPPMMLYDRVGRVEVDITRPPPALPPFHGHGYEADRVPDGYRGYRGSSRPSWERPEGPPADDRYGGPSSRGVVADIADRPPPTVRDDFRNRDSNNAPASQPAPRPEPSRTRPEDLPPPPPPPPAAEPPAANDHFSDTSSKGNGDDIGYDDISDDELDDLIGGAVEDREEKEAEKTAFVDILDIKWDSLVQQDQSKQPALPGSAIRRYAAHNIFSKIGVSAEFAGDALLRKLTAVCQQQIDGEAVALAAAANAENEENTAETDSEQTPGVKSEMLAVVKTEVTDTATNENKPVEQDRDSKQKVPQPLPLPSKFELLSPVAEFHSTAVKRNKERQELVFNIGPYRRALCARRDLAMRRALCKFDKAEEMWPLQVVDNDLYKQSLQLFRQDRIASERKLLTSSVAV